MNKFQCKKILEANGDSTITIRGEEDIVATIDFSTPYIRKNNKYIKIPKDKNLMSVFSWTDNQFRIIDIRNIKSIKPLSDTLKNTSTEEYNNGF